MLVIIYHSNAFLSSSIGHAWLEFRRDEMFYTEYTIFKLILEFFFMYYRVYYRFEPY